MKNEAEIRPKLEAKPTAHVEFWRAVKPVVDPKMPVDQSCAQFCPHNAISWAEGKIKIDYSRCDGCLICLRECHSGAIKEARE